MAYDMRISDWSSDVCSSDLLSVSISPLPCAPYFCAAARGKRDRGPADNAVLAPRRRCADTARFGPRFGIQCAAHLRHCEEAQADEAIQARCPIWRSEEHTSELQSLMRISYAAFCLKKKKMSHPVTLLTLEKKNTQARR